MQSENNMTDHSRSILASPTPLEAERQAPPARRLGICRRVTIAMNFTSCPQYRMIHDNLAIPPFPYRGFQILPLGFMLEFTLLLLVALIAPRWVPGLMGMIWAETAIV
jgi:hypothetical protein